MIDNLNMKDMVKAMNHTDICVDSLIKHAQEHLKLDPSHSIMMFIASIVKVGADNNIDSFGLMKVFCNIGGYKASPEELKEIKNLESLIRKQAKKDMQ